MTKNAQSSLHDQLARLAIAVTDLADGLRIQTRRTDALVAKLADVDRLAALLEERTEPPAARVAPAAIHREPSGDYSFWLGGQLH